MHYKQGTSKKRANSLIEDYQTRKQKLPFIKPRYMRQDMFGFSHSNKKSTVRSNLVRNQIKNTQPFKQRYEYSRKISPKHHEELDSNKDKKIRLRFNDLYKNKQKQQTVQQLKDQRREQQSFPINQQQKQMKQDGNVNEIFHSFFKKKKIKNYKYKKQKTQQISALPDQILKQKILYIPLLIHQNFTYQNLQKSPLKEGKIVRQRIIKTQNCSPSPGKVKHQYIPNKNLLKKFKRVFHSILFIIYLKRYSNKFQGRRKRFLQKTGAQTIKAKFIQLKLFIVSKCTPLLQSLSTLNEDNYQILQKEDIQIKNHKNLILRKLIKILLDCLHKFVDDLNGRTHFIEIIYSICKHGSYSCQWQFHTPQQMDIICISQKAGYICADHYLQRSSILSLIYIKTIIFNFLLKPQTVNFPLSPSKNKSIINFNMKILGNIFYQMIITLQDRYLQSANQNLKIGNWRKLSYKFDLRTAQSMTVKPGIFQKNELISGLYGHNYVRNLYKIQQMSLQLQMMEEEVIKLHVFIKQHHIKIRTNCM